MRSIQQWKHRRHVRDHCTLRLCQTVAVMGEAAAMVVGVEMEAAVAMGKAHSSLRSGRRSLSDTARLGTPRTRSSTHH